MFWVKGIYRDRATVVDLDKACAVQIFSKQGQEVVFVEFVSAFEEGHSYLFVEEEAIARARQWEESRLKGS